MSAGTYLSRFVQCGRCGNSCRESDRDSCTVYDGAGRVVLICHERCLTPAEREQFKDELARPR